MMTKDEFVELMHLWDARFRMSDAEYERVGNMVTVDWWCRHVAPLDTLLLRALASATGITEDALSWFVYENHFGRDAKVCKDMQTGKSTAITTPGVFWDFEHRLTQPQTM